MDALDLAVEDRVGIDRLTLVLAEPIREGGLGRALGRPDRAAEGRVTGEWLELCELPEVVDPAVADGARDGAGQPGIGQQEPPPRRHAVSLVAEPLGKRLGQVLHRGRAQQL